MNINFNKDKQIILPREELIKYQIDIGGRDIIIGFNEPAFRKSRKKLNQPDLDAKLCARLPTYFLPAVEIARMQAKRPRFWIVSGINMAFKWNAQNDEQRKIMMINNRLKFDFLKNFFELFFKNDFSIIEYAVIQDPLRISEDKLLLLWSLIEKRYKTKINGIKIDLAKFKEPKLFNTEMISLEAKKFLKSQDKELVNAFKYAVAHIFVFGDANFEGNYILNPKGFLSIGSHQEKVFNQIRDFALEIIKEKGERIFGQKIIFENNLKLVLENKIQNPPAYNCAFRTFGSHNNRGLEIDEVTYENNRQLDFYDNHPKLKYEMDYMYTNLIDRKKYEEFWDNYREKYFDLKNRYIEAYEIKNF